MIVARPGRPGRERREVRRRAADHRGQPRSREVRRPPAAVSARAGKGRRRPRARRPGATRAVTLAEIALDDGQRLLAFNDLFVGTQDARLCPLSHQVRGAAEAQSSSGVLISTGAGSTGWMSSVFNMAAGVTRLAGGRGVSGMQFEWEDPRLIFAVREPFSSRHSRATIVAGIVDKGEEVVLESLMPSGGVIFSDGIESDYLEFSAGAVGRVRAAAQHAMLVVDAKEARGTH